ncbi:lysine biosynthesis protein LysW [Kibdelosporangium persicum]|uniref:lysine biosynthesis protein LysW n=1 Tax=Kibdelosporangium persicum TaxID=2698649 RepID=UPI0015662E21|nr:lysine biosynthesis protein LysW [Kibdelosporangium persicum]
MALSCPECESEVSPPEPVRQHEVLECPDCRAELEVIAVEPVVLALAPEIEEDWGE